MASQGFSDLGGVAEAVVAGVGELAEADAAGDAQAVPEQAGEVHVEVIVVEGELGALAGGALDGGVGLQLEAPLVGAVAGGEAGDAGDGAEAEAEVGVVVDRREGAELDAVGLGGAGVLLSFLGERVAGEQAQAGDHQRGEGAGEGAARQGAIEGGGHGWGSW
jgi:hypothetical protein